VVAKIQTENKLHVYVMLLWLCFTMASYAGKRDVKLSRISVKKMVNESIFFSNDVGDRTANLLYIPLEIDSVRSADLEVTYAEGEDYTVNQKLGIICLTKKSKIKSYNLLNNVVGTRRFKNPNNNNQPFLHGEDDFIHSKQCVVSYTYEHSDLDKEEIWEKSYQEKFINFKKKLSQKSAKVTLIGDSISVGYNASGFVGAKPNLPAYGPQVVTSLERMASAKIDFQNISQGGAVAKWALGQLGAVTKHNPDLVVIAFGMNDSGRSDFESKSDNYEKAIKEIIDQLRSHNASVEIVLVANMLSNNDFKPHAGHFENRSRLYKIAQVYENIAVADVMAFTEFLLKRKKFSDISGNNLNHPNDFLHGLYAEVILNVLGYGEIK